MWLRAAAAPTNPLDRPPAPAPGGGFKGRVRADDVPPMRHAAAWLMLLACAPASAEIYRCIAADGSVRFAGDAGACPDAERHEPGGALQRVAPERDTPPASRDATSPAAVFTSLEELFPPARAAGSSGIWEVVKEAPEGPATDPDLREWGVREKRVRHYTHRDATGRVRVCSVELWAFADEERARVAEQQLSYPNWRFERRGAVIVMLHGVSRERGQRASHAVFAECTRLGARIAARAEGLSR
jgi:hypothetical protein